jgi:hypothetical protein
MVHRHVIGKLKEKLARQQMTKLLVKLIEIGPEAQDSAIELSYAMVKVAAAFIGLQDEQLAGQLSDYCHEQLDRSWLEMSAEEADESN